MPSKMIGFFWGARRLTNFVEVFHGVRASKTILCARKVINHIDTETVNVHFIDGGIWRWDPCGFWQVAADREIKGRVHEVVESVMDDSPVRNVNQTLCGALRCHCLKSVALLSLKSPSGSWNSNCRPRPMSCSAVSGILYPSIDSSPRDGSMSRTIRPLSLPVTTPMFASGHWFHHRRMIAAPVSPLRVRGCLPTLSQPFFRQEQLLSLGVWNGRMGQPRSAYKRAVLM